MRFGYGLITCQRHPDDARSDVDLYREALDLAEEAEAWGFDSVWTSEHHFQDDAYMPSVLPLSAAIAARTTRIHIGVGVALAPFYDPIRLAEDAATVDLISEGRFILGLGLGWLDWEFEAFGQARRDRVPRTESLISVCREAWGNGLLEQTGVQVTPKPAQAGGPPIWIGATAEPAVRRAGKLADGFMASEPTLTAFAEQVGWINEERSVSESSPFGMSGYWPVFVSEDGNAWESVRPYLHYMEWKYEDSEQSRGRLGPLPAAPALDPETEVALRSASVLGTPEEVVGQIRGLADIAGNDFTFVGRFYYPGMDRDIMRESARLFAEEVIPAFR